MDKRKVSAAAAGKMLVGRKVAKMRQGHSKIFKNLSTPNNMQASSPFRSTSTRKIYPLALSTVRSPLSQIRPNIPCASNPLSVTIPLIPTENAFL